MPFNSRFSRVCSSRNAWPAIYRFSHRPRNARTLPAPRLRLPPCCSALSAVPQPPSSPPEAESGRPRFPRASEDRRRGWSAGRCAPPRFPGICGCSRDLRARRRAAFRCIRWMAASGVRNSCDMFATKSLRTRSSRSSSVMSCSVAMAPPVPDSGRGTACTSNVLPCALSRFMRSREGSPLAITRDSNCRSAGSRTRCTSERLPEAACGREPRGRTHRCRK